MAVRALPSIPVFMAVALRFAADIAEVNSYARGDLLDAAGKLHSVGAPQAQVIRSALGDRNPDGPISGRKPQLSSRLGAGRLLSAWASLLMPYDPACWRAQALGGRYGIGNEHRRGCQLPLV